jgi:SAM-dependent methyltransferase
MEDRRGIAADFDIRSADYSKNQWHRAYAEGLIANSSLGLGDRVLDAGVGTGFAALAAAVRVGPRGRVVGVDVSSGMLQQARIAIEASGLGNIELLQADACDLRGLEDKSFDAVVCCGADHRSPLPSPSFTDNTSERYRHNAWTIKIRGILPSSDRSFKKLEGTETETVTENDDRSWFLSRSSHVAPLQMRANGDLEPVQVTVKTTWNLGLEP